MDRALDPELLSLALGQTQNLPSPERVAELIAEAELALLLHDPEISNDLISVGWYLHAIASSRYALDVYGIERQRAAFKVSAHIFDLVLRSPEINELNRLKYTFGSQIAYLRGKLDPNAVAMYAREFAADLSELNLIPDFQEIALSCGVALLGLDVPYIYRNVQSLQTETERLVGEWDVENIFATPFESAVGVAFGTRNLLNFLVYGGDAALTQAREFFRLAVLAENSPNDQFSRWVAAHLLNIGGDLANASIWTALPPNVPASVKRAFTMGDPKILTLWPPQLDLIDNDDDDRNPLSGTVRRLFLSTPTSGGKTLLAQLLIVTHLATKQNSVCYVAPTRSLCREVRKSLQARLRFLDAEIVADLPEGSWLDHLIDFEPDVEVMTPERLAYLIRTDSAQVLSEFGMFVFDEVHTIGDPKRGWTLEEDLAYLHNATEETDHKIIIMSAVVGNEIHFVEWLGRDEQTVEHLKSEWRGPRRVHSIWRTRADWDNLWFEEVTGARKYPQRRWCPLHGQLDARISHTGRVFSLVTEEPIGSLVHKIDVDGNPAGKDYKRGTAFYRTLIHIIEHLAQSGPLLVVESTRANAVRMAQAIAEDHDETRDPSVRSLIELVGARLGTNHPLREVLQKGVAYHHGALPGDLRASIEEAMSDGSVGILVSTTTMTEGINLPVRSVVIASQGMHTREGYEEYITGSKLINAIGRAGRATKETEGMVVLARNAEPDPSDLDRLSPEYSQLEIISTLATGEALEALAEFEELRQTAEDAVFETASNIINGFLTFVWFVAAELEKLGEDPELDDLREVLKDTLAWQQLGSVDQDRWLSVTELTLDRYKQADDFQRRRWASGGTSLSSASQIEEIADDIAQTLAERGSVPQRSDEIIDLIIDEQRLQRIIDLPEAPETKAYTQRSGNREQIPIPLDELLLQWVRGTRRVILADTYFGVVPDISYKFEQLADFIYDYFTVYFPWVFGTIIAWTNHRLRENGFIELLPVTIPANIRWGVNNAVALGLIAKGIQSRQLSLRIAEAWINEDGEGDVHRWIRSMSVVDWRELFDASRLDVRNLLEFSRQQKGGAAAELITEESVRLEVESQVDDFDWSDATLSSMVDDQVSRVEVWVDNILVGHVREKDQADVRSLLDAGLPFSVQFRSVSGTGQLDFELWRPDS